MAVTQQSQIESAGEEKLKSTSAPKAVNRAAALLTVAGCIVIVAAFVGHLASTKLLLGNPPAGQSTQRWGIALYLVLSLLIMAIALSTTAMLRRTDWGYGASPVRVGSGRPWLIFAGLVVLHASLAILVFRPGSGALIDTYTFQRDACNNLVHGVDPYGATQANLYSEQLTSLVYGPGMVVNGRVQVGFQYPPLTLLWALAGYFMGDVRLSYILAVIVSAWLMLALRPDGRGLGLAAVLLFSPLTFVVEYLCWTEPLVLMTLSATVHAAAKKRWWLPIALGLFLASKQYNFLALPLIAYFVRPFEWRAYWRLTGISAAVGAATVLPFAVWNFHGLWRDLVLFHLAQPFRPDAMSFAVLFPWMMKVGPVLVLGFLVWALRFGERSPAMFAAACGVALLLFVCTSKQAFANYYFLIGQAFFLSAAALWGREQRTQEKLVA